MSWPAGDSKGTGLELESVADWEEGESAAKRFVRLVGTTEEGPGLKPLGWAGSGGFGGGGGIG
jgi:hypothetical protein